MKKSLSFFLNLILVFCSFSALTLQTEAYYGNNSFGNAATISINQSYISNIMDSSDEDWFKFTLTTAGKINIDFSHTYVNESTIYWVLTLYDSNQNPITDSWYYHGETTKTVTTGNIGLPAGTYYIKVEPYGISTVDYCIKVNFTASSVWEKEFNDDYYTSSNSISLNKEYYGTTMDSSDEDWFKFTLTTAGKINIDFSHTYVNESTIYWVLTLYDSNQNPITDSWYYHGETTKTVTTGNIGLPAGTYYIKVEPYGISTVDYCLMVSDYVATPKLTSISNGSGKVTVKWDKVSGAKGYYVYRKTYSNGKWSSWSKVTTTTNNYYSDTNISSGKYYKYTVRAYIGETISGYNTTGLQTKYLAVAPLKSAVSQSAGVKVTWGKVTGASGYYVYRQTYSNGKWSGWKKVATTSNNYYNDTNVSSGNYYKYTVRAYNGSYVSYYNTTGLKTKYLAVTPLKSAVSQSVGVKVTWGKVAGAKGYNIYRQTYSNGKWSGWSKIKTVSGGSTVTYTDKSAKKGVTYKYTVRATSDSYIGYYDTKGLQVKDKY